MSVRSTRVVVTLPMLLVGVGVASAPLFTNDETSLAASLIFGVVTPVAFGTLPLLIYFSVRMLRLMNAAQTRGIVGLPQIDLWRSE